MAYIIKDLSGEKLTQVQDCLSKLGLKLERVYDPDLRTTTVRKKFLKSTLKKRLNTLTVRPLMSISSARNCWVRCRSPSNCFCRVLVQNHAVKKSVVYELSKRVKGKRVDIVEFLRTFETGEELEISNKTMQ